MADRIGELLVARSGLATEKLDDALEYQRSSPDRLGTVLVNLGAIRAEELAEALAVQLDSTVVREAAYPRYPVAADRLSPGFLHRVQAVPIDEDDGRVVVAFADPTARDDVDALANALDKPVEVRVGLPDEVHAALLRLYGAPAIPSPGARRVGGLAPAHRQRDIDLLQDRSAGEPVIQFVDRVIERAVEARASDIHVEPLDHRLRVRFRIDGMLRDVDSPPLEWKDEIANRVKVVAKLKQNERRRPQDGRRKHPVAGRELDLRVSTVPTVHGESIVVRLLDRREMPLDFAALGFSGEALAGLERMLDRPYGIVLVTGPTGSGKTTTLYAALERLNTVERKILTVEDPVEYQIEGVNQIHVNEEVNLTFAVALRHILRQDPDVIMVGEIRDEETARMAVQAALTGHKVLSTVHTNDAASTIGRLLDMRVEDYLLVSTLNGVVAQRLVRVLCERCREPYAPSDHQIRELELERFAPAGSPTLYRAGGCEACAGTGYFGRTGIVELLAMTPALRTAVLERRDASIIARIGRDQGDGTMYEDGLRKALAGITSLDEVERVTRETD